MRIFAESEVGEAIDYLKRVRGTLHPEEDFFTNLPLVSKMLNIQTAYLERLVATDRADMAKLIIDSTGLPELPSWKVDISNAFEEFHAIKSRRAQDMRPLLDSITRLNFDNITSEGESVSKSLEGDRILTSVLETVTPMETEILREIESSTFPISPSSPSGLAIVKGRPHINYSPQGDIKYVHSPSQIGIKYLDSHQPRPAPSMLYYWYTSINDVIIRISDSDSIYKTSRQWGYQVRNLDDTDQSAGTQRSDLEENIVKMVPEIQSFLISADLSLFGNSGNHMGLILAYDHLWAQTVQVLSRTLGGGTVEPAQFKEQMFKFASESKSLLGQFPELIQNELKVATAKTLKRIQGSAQIALRDSQPTSTQMLPALPADQELFPNLKNHLPGAITTTGKDIFEKIKDVWKTIFVLH